MNNEYRAEKDGAKLITPGGRAVFNDSVAFARGYLFVQEKIRPSFIPSAWIRFEHGSWVCWHDPRVAALSHHAETAKVSLLGYVINLDDSRQSLPEIVRYLCGELTISRDRFLSALERLSGRYLIVDSSSAGTFAQSDAVALRPIFAASRKKTFGSHQNLVRLAAGIDELSAFGHPSWWRENRARTYPGYKTHWEGVSLVPANHELCLDSMKFTRIAMTVEDPHTVEQALERLDYDFSTQVGVLSRRRNPVLSVTAGADSRVSLAATLACQSQFHYFTYGLTYSRRKRAVETDLHDSNRVAKTSKLTNYSQLLVESPLQEGRLKRVLQGNSPRTSNLNLAARYLDEFPDSEVHIRSNTFEIATASYQKIYGYRDSSPEILSSIHVFQNEYTKDTVDALAEYYEYSRLSEVEGYDALDLYYWEIRMGSWLAQVVYESDPSFDSHIFVNSRSILAYLLSLPLDARMNSSVYRRFVGSKSLPLAELPINGAQ